MQLSDEKVLETLLGDLEKRTLRKKTTRPRIPSAPSADYEAPTAKSRLRRCQCGVCATCQDNLRWERIFVAKFADATYYSRNRPLSHGSPLRDC